MVCDVSKRREAWVPISHFSLAAEATKDTESWRFWIHWCNWSIFEKGEKIAFSEASDDEISSAAERINGRTLDNLSLEKAFWEDTILYQSTLQFSGHYRIKLQQYHGMPADGNAIFQVTISDHTRLTYADSGKLELFADQ